MYRRKCSKPIIINFELSITHKLNIVVSVLEKCNDISLSFYFTHKKCKPVAQIGVLRPPLNFKVVFEGSCCVIEIFFILFT